MKRFLLLLIFLLATVPALAAEIVVLPTQDLRTAILAARAGDVLIVEDSVREGGIFATVSPGTELLPICMKARNPGKVVIRGSTATRPDAMSLQRAHWWKIEGFVFEGAASRGLQLGTSNHATVFNCTIRQCGSQGILATGNFITVENCQIYLIEREHCVYISGAYEGCIVRNNILYSAGKSSIQFNAQGSGGVARNALIEGNSCFNTGLSAGGANAINLIGLVQSKVQQNYLSDNVGGIAMSGGSTGNLVYGNLITFRGGTGRQCVTATDSLPTTNSVAGNIFRMGRTGISPTQANNAATLMLADNTTLPVATRVLPVPDDAGPVPP